MAAANQGRRTLGSLFKKGWNEIPEVMGSSVMALIGFSMTGVALWKYYSTDGDNRRYKTTYTVYRPDDPRVAKIRKD